MKAVELYAGAGGLAMGVSLAGFQSLAVVEWDRWACDTIRENQRRGFPLVANWPLYEGDVRKFDWSRLEGEEVDLLAGGPPCQPFSMGGKHQAHDDTRDMFPATVDIVRKLRPKAFIVENVKGLTRSTFANYYQYILLQLEFPEVPARRNEEWFDHLLRLQAERTSGRQKGGKLTYNVVPTLVNAADYGVPQKRERVFIVGFRTDLDVDWSFPRPTHSYDSLLRDQWVTGEYWERHQVSRRARPTMPASLANRVRRIANSLPLADELPWRTVRDALAGLPSPLARTASQYADHRFQPGARVYPGHTGSPLDLPGKTLKAGDHGVPGGENMLVNTDGSVRYFSIRESARMQTFPDGFKFHGSWTETMRQLGNAVPVALGHVVARSVAERLATVQLEQLARQRVVARGAA
ncbi:MULTISPECIES: DNA cytosine methyltransferase [pseudomallei group]|uniref:DNA cytosine methyltransferase n=1 Tax=pseudomallei group TaxID=111527 RepID=UPI00075EB8C2|nr:MULTISPECIES: DNA cytosine methyltransferase [pseudomallei group]AOJ79399.1 multidrug DMT transporter [Burkholderia savannae]MBO2971052.1 DNA cytosine methyltransferase [Burkholderia pseudomallei]MBO3033071.1 DNA cytosine methyltransferase [Burkholderia pseudomallei]MBO3055384.1 DNA cytosine methyltransferase [Burkholderia pseudomallei]MBO7758255.1 DNA cytosine methyltransferase [Burkholderia pseudomallei]